jgi:hypothetical protein
MKAKPVEHAFESMIRLLRTTARGCTIESFVRVEMGEEYLRAAWDAFKDIADFFDEEYLGNEAMLNQFLIALEDEVRFSELGIAPCL